MNVRSTLVALSTAQLALGLRGLRVALRDGVPADAPLIRRRRDRMRSEQWIVGTGLSAPGGMMAAQLAFTAALVVRPSRRAAGALGVLGAAMAIGYLIEAGFARAVRHPDRLRAPLLLGGFILAVGMLVLGTRSVHGG